MAMLAHFYNASTANVKGTTTTPRFSTCARAAFRESERAGDFEQAETTLIVSSDGTRADSCQIPVAVGTVLARRVHYSTLDHAGVVAVIIL
jgi:hypothetical protein